MGVPPMNHGRAEENDGYFGRKMGGRKIYSSAVLFFSAPIGIGITGERPFHRRIHVTFSNRMSKIRAA